MKKIQYIVILVIMIVGVITTGLIFFRGDDVNQNQTTTTLDEKYRGEFELDYYDPFKDPDIVTPERSTFFSTVIVEDSSSYDTYSDGDLWPAAWSDDDILYLANGDGKGFNMQGHWEDIVMNKLTGTPYEHNLVGEKIEPSTSISQVWGKSTSYNRKPTGMVSVDGVLYMAVQDLNKVEGPKMFNDAPNATIIRSDNKGETWSWDPSSPMFSDYRFTTVMFLDYGKDSQDNVFDEYVYAYGLDYNWRDSFSNSVTDPTNLYLARMPKDGIQDVSKWEFYTGDLNGNPSWSAPGAISEKKPVLTDERRIYTNRIDGRHNDMTVLSQGSIVYNKPLERYIYTSWTEYTFEFYESPTPYGPWKHFYTKDFGAYPWTNSKFGGYATVVPSKFISEDGKTMYVNANTFVGGIHKYNFSLRKFEVNPYEETTPTNEKSDLNLALENNSNNPTPISIATKLGLYNKLNDGKLRVWDESYNRIRKDYDYWGFTWSKAYNLNNLTYTVGKVTDKGGWFTDFKVQVRQNHEWVDVEGLRISDNYVFDEKLESFSTIDISFNDTWGDGVRIIGIPGGDYYYTSAAELEVYYK